MKKVVFASFLAFATLLCSVAHAQSQITIKDPAEYNAYTNATSQPTPQAKAAAIESFLNTYPQTVVKEDMLEQLLVAYQQTGDNARLLATADKLLQINPTNLRALTIEVYLKRAMAGQQTDPAQRQTMLDDAASLAKRGLTAPKPAAMSDADYQKMKETVTPIFHGAIATAAYNKKDYVTAIAEFKAELQSMPLAQTSVPGPALQDTFYIGMAYLNSTPPDLINCTWYVARAAHFAPEQYKAQMLPTAQYCYKRYHGNLDGFDQVDAQVATNLFPPTGFTITPAPKPADLVAQLIASTPDLKTLALSDKEYALSNGNPDDAAKVWAVMQGIVTEVPGTVVTATPDTVTLMVSDDAVQNKVADFTINMKKPMKDSVVPKPGDQIKLIATFASYTQKPMMIILSDGELPPPVVKKPSPARRPRRR